MDLFNHINSKTLFLSLIKKMGNSHKILVLKIESFSKQWRLTSKE
jgi:hypothetical protein